MMETNVNNAIVSSFGKQWAYFDQSMRPESDLKAQFDEYFRLFAWDSLPDNAVGADIGCGSGRWAMFAAPRVSKLHCVDASDEALEVARRNLQAHENCEFSQASIGDLPFGNNSLDFAYSLGVLHYVPDASQGIRECARVLRPGAPLLLYVYYAFDNRPAWFRLLWRISDIGRRIISRMPFRFRRTITDAIAMGVYWPLARLARAAESCGLPVSSMPLAAYRSKPLYVMRTDALDRFGSKLERRYTAPQIKEMMEAAGLERVRFLEDIPYWCAIAYKPSITVSFEMPFERHV